MKITKRQLRRIIKEEVFREHAYDDAKHSVADKTRESDAADEVLDDLYSLGDPKLADKVDTMIQMGDDLGSILGVIPDAVKDKLMDPSMTISSKDDGRGHATRAPSAAAVNQKEEAKLVDALVKKDPELQDAILSVGYVYYFIREIYKLSKDAPGGRRGWYDDNQFEDGSWRASAEIKELMSTINLGPEAWGLFKSGKASVIHMDSSTVLGAYLDSANAGHPAPAGSGGMTLTQALQVISGAFPTKNFLVSKIDSEIQAVTAAAQKQSSTPVAEGSAIRVTRGQLRRIIKETYGGAKGSFPGRYGDAHVQYTSRAGTLGEDSENYVLERSGVGWGEKFFVELDGRNGVHWGPLASAQKFRDTPAAEKMQKEIDRLEGFYTRVRPTSFFK